ncbi:MAG: hypothetical protein AAF560_34320, partial [Acidobacteriota bacterium]
GNLLAEPGAVVVTAFARELTDPAARAAERGELVEALSEPPEGSQLIAGPEAVMIGEMEGVSVSFRHDRGLEEELAFALLGNALIRVNSVRWPVFGGAVEPGYASRVLASLEIVGGATENELPPSYDVLIERLTPLAETGSMVAQNNLAWLLATCSDPAYHDGEAAVRFAGMAVLQNEDSVAYRDTLAAAYARAGRFEDAVRAQRKALSMLEEGADRSGFEQRLELYRNGEAYVER